MANHSSILAWRISLTEEPGGLSSQGHKESDMTEATNTHTHTHTNTQSPPSSSNVIQKLRKTSSWDFPGCPVVKTSPSNAGDMGSIPGQGVKIPHASQSKHQNTKQKQWCNKFNKNFKMVHSKTTTTTKPSFLLCEQHFPQLFSKCVIVYYWTPFFHLVIKMIYFTLVQYFAGIIFLLLLLFLFLLHLLSSIITSVHICDFQREPKWIAKENIINSL